MSLGFGSAGWEPPFIHHMVKPWLYSRHFRNLTTTPKLPANQNSSTWFCTFLLSQVLVWGFCFSSSTVLLQESTDNQREYYEPSQTALIELECRPSFNLKENATPTVLSHCGVKVLTVQVVF